jgi:hypothetical protein
MRIIPHAAIRVGSVTKEPLQRFRFKVLAREEEKRKPAPTESIDVCAVTHQKFRHRRAAGPRGQKPRVVDERLAKFRAGGQHCFDARNIVASDRMLQLPNLFE